MKINQIHAISEDGGNWIILTEYGSEGIAVSSQHETPEDAIKHLGENGGGAQAIVLLPDFKFSVSEK